MHLYFKLLYKLKVYLENKEQHEALLFVDINADDYQSELEKSLRDYSKKANIPGFRKGMVPVGVIKNMVGKDLKRESIEKLLQKNISDYLNDNDVPMFFSPLSSHSNEHLDWSSDNFTFKYEIALRPKLNIDLSILNGLEKLEPEISDEDLEHDLKMLKVNKGKFDEVDAIDWNKENLHVYMTLTELDDANQPLEGGLSIKKAVTKTELPGKLLDFLSEKVKDFSENINLKTLVTTDEIMNLFGKDKNTAEDAGDNFLLEVKNVYTITPPEMNQDFFDAQLGKDKATTEEEFREEWRKVMKDYYGREGEGKLTKLVKDKLTETIKMEFSEPLLTKYYKALVKPDDKENKTSYEEFIDYLKWKTIAENIAEKNQISVTDEDIRSFTEMNIRNSFMRYGIDFPEDRIKEMVDMDLKKEGNYDDASHTIFYGKVMANIKQNFTPSIKTLPLKQFQEITKQSDNE